MASFRFINMNLVRIHMIFSLEPTQRYDLALDDESFRLAKELDEFTIENFQQDHPKLYDLTALLIKAGIPLPGEPNFPEDGFGDRKADPQTLAALNSWNVQPAAPPYREVHTILLFLF